jgi:peptidyl-dipeptidase Dcp
VKAVHEQKATLNLNRANHFVRWKYKSFSRNGANPEDKKTNHEIDKELSKTSLQFGENVLAETQGFELHITNDEDLSDYRKEL